MGKLDPIVSEFATEEDAQAHDAWFRAQVETALASTKSRIPDDDVQARARAVIEKRRDARPDLGA